MAIHIGTSGWSYAHWTNVLYPEGLPADGRLAYYVRQFATVELNASFYRWPSDAAFASWQRRLPAEFLMTVKAPRALTHAKRLYDPDPWLARIRGGLSCLSSKRGVLLVQLPPPPPPSIIPASRISLSECRAGYASRSSSATTAGSRTARSRYSSTTGPRTAS